MLYAHGHSRHHRRWWRWHHHHHHHQHQRGLCVIGEGFDRPPAPARRTTAVHDLDGWFDGSPFSGWHYFKIHPTILSIVFEQYRDQTVACLSAYVVPQHTHTQEGARGCCGKMLSSCSWQPNRHVCVFVKTCRKADAGPISRPHSKIGVNVRVRLFFAVNQRFASSRSRACLERYVPGTNWGDFGCFFSLLLLRMSLLADGVWCKERTVDCKREGRYFWAFRWHLSVMGPWVVFFFGGFFSFLFCVVWAKEFLYLFTAFGLCVGCVGPRWHALRSSYIAVVTASSCVLCVRLLPKLWWIQFP